VNPFRSDLRSDETPVSGSWAENMAVVLSGDEEDAKETLAPGCHTAERSVIAVHARQTTATKTDRVMPRDTFRVTSRFVNLCHTLCMSSGKPFLKTTEDKM
jgi:hypothetical protein